MNLIIDVGNSRTKYFAIHGGEVVGAESEDGHDLRGLSSFVSRHTFDAAAVCSVVDLDDASRARLEALRVPVLTLDASTPVPLANAYHTPATLGLDRLAAAVGAHERWPGTPLLVIDAGSCITFDFVTAEGCYVGGNIAPGLHARLRSIGDYFPRLPHVDAHGEAPGLGYDTATAIRSGAVCGIAHEIEGYIHALRSEHPELTVFLTGGDDMILARDVETAIIRDPHLVARGLNAILEYNLTPDRPAKAFSTDNDKP